MFRVKPCPATARLLTPLSALCSDQYCPNDVLSTIDALYWAVYEDVLTAIRITFKCLGVPQGSFIQRPAVCICQLVKILAPEWRKLAKLDPDANKELLCENGDPFDTIMNRVMEEIGDSFQKGAEQLGDMLIDNYENFFGSIARMFDPAAENPKLKPEICISTLKNVLNPSQLEHCGDSWAAATEQAIQFQCETEKPEWKRCYYHRVREICKKDDFIQRYQALFDRGFESITDLQASYSDAFGDAILENDPTLGAILGDAARNIESPRDLSARKNICSGKSFLESMSLDDIIISCLFAYFDDFCTVDNDFEFELRVVTWEIPRVRCAQNHNALLCKSNLSPLCSPTQV